MSLLVTGRVSFPSFFSTAVIEGKDSGKYGCAIMIPKADTETQKKIEKLEIEAAQKFFGDKIPKGLTRALLDGDEIENRPEYAGHWIIRPKSKNAPEVVDQHVKPIDDPQGIRSGDYVRVSVNFYGYKVQGNQGVASGLGNVQFVKRGEPLGNQKRAEDEFEAIAVDDVADEGEGGGDAGAFFG